MPWDPKDWSPKGGNPADLKAAREAVEDTRKMIREVGYSGDVPLGKTWALTFGHSRDSEILEESNWDTIASDLEKRFPNDVEVVRFGHFGVGWIEELAVRMLDDRGRVTRAAKAALEWQHELERYPVADEDDLSRREHEAEIQEKELEPEPEPEAPEPETAHEDPAQLRFWPKPEGPALGERSAQKTILFDGVKYRVGGHYRFDELPPLTRRAAMRQAADLEIHYGHDARDLIYELVVVPHADLERILKDRLGESLKTASARPEIVKIASAIERRGLKNPPIADEGVEEALALWSLGLDMPYFRVSETMDLPGPYLDGRNR